jgi:hypothetical protein
VEQASCLRFRICRLEARTTFPAAATGAWFRFDAGFAAGIIARHGFT